MDGKINEIIDQAPEIVTAIAESLPEHSKRITNFVENLQEKKPEITERLLVASGICK